jgi:hypothetical protein
MYVLFRTYYFADNTDIDVSDVLGLQKQVLHSLIILIKYLGDNNYARFQSSQKREWLLFWFVTQELVEVFGKLKVHNVMFIQNTNKFLRPFFILLI